MVAGCGIHPVGVDFTLNIKIHIYIVDAVRFVYELHNDAFIAWDCILSGHYANGIDNARVWQGCDAA